MRVMSSDGAMDKPRSARPARGDDRGLASVALGVLLVLALVATVVMIFSDNPVWMRIGTLAALWAAFIGAFLVARYRRQAAAEAARVRDLHTVYELQLEREISARREHELVVERDIRASVRAETGDSIVALRQEIAALREQLGALGVTLPEDRFAVGGPGPAGQLGAGSSLPNVPSERVEPRRRTTGSYADPDSTAASPSGSEPDRAGGYGSRPAAASGVGADSTPSTERTERLSPVSGRTAGSPASAGERRRPAVRPTTGTGTGSGAGAERQGTPGAGAERSSAATSAASGATGSSSVSGYSPRAWSAEPPRTRSTDAASASDRAGGSRRSEETPAAGSTTPTAGSSRPGTTRADIAESGATRAATGAATGAATTTESTTDGTPGGTPDAATGSRRSQPRSTPPTDSAPPSRHGEGSGLSVAELMARLGGDSAPSSGRRRRRSED